MYKTSVGDCRGVMPLAITKNVLLNSSASGGFLLLMGTVQTPAK